jgi:tRNA-Thr(GGU) m(6)t(6)A37 methyltransferase TsaA
VRSSDEELCPPILTLTPIGVIHSEHRDPGRTPIQTVCAVGSPGRVEVFEDFADGLADIEGFSHLHLLYWLHRAAPASLTVMPFLEDVSHGIFATRTPTRPNPLGLSVVRLVGRRGRTLLVEDLDVLDGTPLLDIKPYVERFDVRLGTRGGWTDGIDAATFRRRGTRGDSKA